MGDIQPRLQAALRSFYEKENERLYLSTINGHLEVYLTSSASPLFIKDIETNTSLNYSLNDLVLYDLKHYLFSCSDNSNISVFDLGKKKKKKTTKELSFFNYYKAKFQMLTVLYDQDKNEVIKNSKKLMESIYSME